MFRLNNDKKRAFAVNRVVSILQMFRLNAKNNAQAFDIATGFNTSDVSVEFVLQIPGSALPSLFQYFRCFGWIFLLLQIPSQNHCFNTSDVSVELEKHGFVKIDYRVSILQMFRLNTASAIASTAILRFQYFRCFGWMIYSLKTLQKAVNMFQYFRCFGWIMVRVRNLISRNVSILQMFRLNLSNQ